MSRARAAILDWGPLTIGATFYPYQVSFGLSLQYWPCIFMPSVRIHVGPFKVWMGVRFKRVILIGPSKEAIDAD